MHYTIKIISKQKKNICQRMINCCRDISLELDVQIEVQNEGENNTLEQGISFV